MRDRAEAICTECIGRRRHGGDDKPQRHSGAAALHDNQCCISDHGLDKIDWAALKTVGCIDGPCSTIMAVGLDRGP